MIYGALIPFTREDSFNKLAVIKSLILTKKVSLNIVELECFKGGYLTHPDLPFSASDFVYYDSLRDILVLMSGIVYNSDLFQKRNQNNPALIADLFFEKGPAFFNFLNGDFAIFIYRPQKQTFFLIRDHLGIQPVAYAWENGVFYFSSDFFNLSRAFSKNEEINFEPLLTNIKVINHLETFSKKVKKLKPGHYLEYSENREQIIKYWNPEKVKINKTLNYERVLNDLESLVRDSIEIRSDQKYFASSHLSGGLDSSLIAFLARKQYSNQNDFFGFSWAPRDYKPKDSILDERNLIFETTKEEKITPIFSDITPDDYQDYLKKYFFNQGYFWEEKTRQQAKEQNINLIFSGWGGDEFLSVSDSGINIDLLKTFKWGSFFKRNSIRHPRRLLSILVYNVILPFFGWFGQKNKMSVRETLKYFKKKYRKSNPVSFKTFYKFRSRRDRQIGFINNYHLAERCEQWSIQGFRQGIVYRYPFLDKRIIEYILQVPSDLLFRDNHSRIIIRDLSKGFLPDNVRWNESKLDSVLIERNREILFQLADVLVKEISEWKLNPDLKIIDFSLFEKDLNKFTRDINNEKDEITVQNLVFFKMLHEFTKTYRSLPPESE